MTVPLTWITAHSGCENTPDNSLLSVTTAVSAGADAAEVDVRVLGDELCLTHDPAARAEGLARLSEAMAVARDGGIGLNCDLKDYGALYPALALAQSVGLPAGQLIFSGSVSPETMLKDASIGRRASVCLNSEEICRFLAPEVSDERAAQAAYLADHAEDVAALLRRTGAAALNAPYWSFTEDMLDRLSGAGIPLSLWTVNDEADLRRLLRRPLMNVTTRAPRLALKCRGGQ